MSTPKNPRSSFPADFRMPRASLSLALSIGRKALAVSLAYLMIPIGIGDLYAQETPPPPPPDQQQYQGQPGPDQGPPPDQGQPPQAYNALSPDQLGQLVAPIALYPDSLVAQILAASTYPSEIADADHFVQQNAGAPPDQLGQMADGMNWDPSVKALIAFPSVLANLDKNLDWTSQLGNAYYNQPQDVMSAVQTMRQRAYDAGNLKTTQQLAVTYQPNNIVIAPANPTVVYVPYYNPWGVYGVPVVAYPAYYPPPQPPGFAFGLGLAIGFGVGVAVASWNHWGWGWHSWGMGWGSRTVVYQRNVYVSRSVTVVNHGYYGHYDRNVAARNYNRNMAYRAPNYRPGYNGSNGYRPNNNYNRPGTPNNNYRPGTPNNNYNRPNTSYNRPGAPNSNIRPAYNNNGYRPSTPNNNTRPNTNYNRPATPNNNVNRPTNTARPQQTRPQQQARPQQSRPQPQARQQQSRPAPQHQSRPSGGGGKDKR